MGVVEKDEVEVCTGEARQRHVRLTRNLELVRVLEPCNVRVKCG